VIDLKLLVKSKIHPSVINMLIGIKNTHGAHSLIIIVLKIYNKSRMIIVFMSTRILIKWEQYKRTQNYCYYLCNNK